MSLPDKPACSGRVAQSAIAVTSVQGGGVSHARETFAQRVAICTHGFIAKGINALADVGISNSDASWIMTHMSFFKETIYLGTSDICQ